MTVQLPRDRDRGLHGCADLPFEHGWTWDPDPLSDERRIKISCADRVSVADGSTLHIDLLDVATMSSPRSRVRLRASAPALLRSLYAARSDEQRIEACAALVREVLASLELVARRGILDDWDKPRQQPRYAYVGSSQGRRCVITVISKKTKGENTEPTPWWRDAGNRIPYGCGECTRRLALDCAESNASDMRFVVRVGELDTRQLTFIEGRELGQESNPLTNGRHFDPDNDAEWVA